MTKEERIERIHAKAENDKKAATEKLAADQWEYERLACEIEGLYSRINDVLDVVNACLGAGLKLPDDDYTAKRYGYRGRHGFYADGVGHNVGFDCKHENGYAVPYGGSEIGRIKIENGGYNGPYNFYADGFDFYWKHEDSKRESGICRHPESWKYDMEKFVKEFPVFEKAFYSWVDSLA